MVTRQNLAPVTRESDHKTYLVIHPVSHDKEGSGSFEVTNDKKKKHVSCINVIYIINDESVSKTTMKNSIYKYLYHLNTQLVLYLNLLQPKRGRTTHHRQLKNSDRCNGWVTDINYLRKSLLHSYNTKIQLTAVIIRGMSRNTRKSAIKSYCFHRL